MIEGICWILQNISIESGPISIIKPIGVSLGKINEELMKWINQNYDISVQVRFAIKWIMAPNLGKGGGKDLVFKTFWIRSFGPLTCLTKKPIPWWYDLHKICSRAGTATGLGKVSPTTERGLLKFVRVADYLEVTVPSMMKPWKMSIEITVVK